ncbi:MAG TPA: HU family DNA-binding protein [Saprospiraceae bacterium]|nr:HU family DNA-binding protein [Saprospiraceae bacterium]
MNKQELIESIAAQTGLSKADAGRALDATFDAITGSLTKGDRVAVPGFGTFATSRRAARTGRNPQTGETIKIKARTAVSFKSASKLKEAVN